jgi:signal transduction histidine kinase
VRALDPQKGLRWRHRFQTRIVAWLILLAAAISVVAGVIYYRRQMEFVQDEQDQRGRTLINNLAGQCELGVYAEDRAFLAAPIRRLFAETDVNFVQVYNRRGQLLVGQAKPGIELEKKLPGDQLRRMLSSKSPGLIAESRAGHIDLFAPIVTLDEDAERALFAADSGQEPIVIGIARLGLSRRPAEDKLNAVLRWAIYLSLISLAMGVILALFLAQRLSRPILALARGADEVRKGQLGYQLDVRRSDELGLLAESFNRMSSRLQETVNSLAHLNRNLEQEVSRRTVALRRGRDFSILLNAPLQMRQMFDSALDALIRITGAIAGAMLVRREGQELELGVHRGAEAEVFAFDESYLKQASVNKLLLVDAVPASVAAALPKAQALLSTGLRFQGQIQGLVILVLEKKPDRDQLDFVEDASAQFAIAVSNARAYGAAEELAQRLEQQNVKLMEQRDQLQEVNRLKSEFLANVSHELRTPLNAIIGYAELLSDQVYGPVTSEQAGSLDGVMESADGLLRLINEILDLSKVESGKMTVRIESVDLVQLVSDVVHNAAPLVRERPYVIRTAYPEGQITLTTDGAKVRQILVNLLSNAIKFTLEGAVTVSIASSERGVEVAVTDTGIGIAAEHLELIFDEFRQIDGSYSRAHGGTGLGLSISRKLAHLIGGEISVTSALQQGSTFRLLLPKHAPRRPSTGRIRIDDSRIRTGPTPILKIGSAIGQSGDQ